MDFDWLTIHLDKIDTLPEWVSLLFFLSAIGLAFWYMFNKQKADANTLLNEETISSYKSALEGTRIDLQTQLDHCSAQHKESQDQLAEQNLRIEGLMGEIKTLKEIPLAEMAKGIEKVVSINAKMLDELKKKAFIDAEDRENLNSQSQTIDTQMVKEQVIKGVK